MNNLEKAKKLKEKSDSHIKENIEQIKIRKEAKELLEKMQKENCSNNYPEDIEAIKICVEILK